MNSNQTVKERLKIFISYLGIGQSKFEQEVGLSNAYVNNIRVSIQPKTLEKIVRRYPELSRAWLLTGDGDMLRPSDVDATSQAQSATENADQRQQGNGNSNTQNVSGDPKNLTEALKIINDLSKKNQEMTERLFVIVERLLDKQL